jgi:ferritin
MHAEKFFDFLNDIGGKIVLQNIEQPPYEFSDAQEIFEKALEHEKIVTQSIFAIVKAANEIGDYSTASFLQWFVNEQVEEEATALNSLQKLNW